MVADLLDQLFFIHRFYHLLSARGASGACTYAQTYRSYAVARSNVALPALRPFDPLRAGKLRAGKLRMYGSMGLPISSVFVFSLAERKNENRKEDKVPLRRRLKTPIA